MNRNTFTTLTFSLLIAFFSFLLFTNSALAEMKTFVKEYTYQASDEDSKNSSRTVALREIKRLLLERNKGDGSLYQQHSANPHYFLLSDG